MTTATKPEIKHRTGPVPATTAAPSPNKHRRWWLIAIESAALAVVGIAGLELTLNACGVGMEEILQPDPVMGTTHIPNKQIVWRMEGFSKDQFNSQGLRDVEHSISKPANAYRVALLGDSATEGLQVPTSENYGAFLQKQLNVPNKQVEVLNFGTSGYSTGQEVLQYEREAAQYKPDLTILLYNRGDALENIRKPTDLKAEPRPYFYVDAQGNLQTDNAVLQANEQSLKPNPVIDFLRTNSRLYGVLSHANLTLSINEPHYRKVRSWIMTPFKPRHISRQAPAAYAEQDVWNVTSALISRLDESCRKTGSKLVVVSFPNSVQDPEFGKQIEALHKLGKDKGFSVFDLTPTFRWHPDPKSLFVKYHFSTAGHKVVSEKIAEHLQKSTSL
jgi:lysophospholipase L1-like esterase